MSSPSCYHTILRIMFISLCCVSSSNFAIQSLTFLFFIFFVASVSLEHLADL
ncbi:hypothetical protein MtrunA17_Chr5g0404251 [Medicago truncatula]|uniref:Transmembrane protein n=1 Tax=Medicago truncatula TaxID=3880 RepID=A0A396HNY3_MEDTR|nr:hypothetical protein MtrunA17_Chr5g0404251 [Medicago truncatula]